MKATQSTYLTLLLFATTSIAFGQSLEYDDLYFNSRDREMINASYYEKIRKLNELHEDEKTTPQIDSQDYTSLNNDYYSPDYYQKDDTYWIEDDQGDWTYFNRYGIGYSPNYSPFYGNSYSRQYPIYSFSNPTYPGSYGDSYLIPQYNYYSFDRNYNSFNYQFRDYNNYYFTPTSSGSSSFCPPANTNGYNQNYTYSSYRPSYSSYRSNPQPSPPAETDKNYGPRHKTGYTSYRAPTVENQTNQEPYEIRKPSAQSSQNTTTNAQQSDREPLKKAGTSSHRQVQVNSKRPVHRPVQHRVVSQSSYTNQPSKPSSQRASSNSGSNSTSQSSTKTTSSRPYRTTSSSSNKPKNISSYQQSPNRNTSSSNQRTSTPSYSKPNSSSNRSTTNSYSTSGSRPSKTYSTSSSSSSTNSSYSKPRSTSNRSSSSSTSSYSKPTTNRSSSYSKSSSSNRSSSSSYSRSTYSKPSTSSSRSSTSSYSKPKPSSSAPSKRKPPPSTVRKPSTVYKRK